MGLRDQLTQKFNELKQQHNPTPSSSSSPTTTNTNPPPSNMTTPKSKRGLCWRVGNEEDPVHAFTKPGSKISWLYNWSPHPTPNSSSLEFIPMTWDAVWLHKLAADVENAVPGGAKTLLAFNEPELPDQSNIAVEVAVQKWMEFIEPLRKEKGVRVGSPGISNAGHAVGYLQQFLAGIRAQGSDVDFLCIHWYGPDLGGFYDYIWSTRHQLDANKPVWITEFACTNWNEGAPLPLDHVENFARESVKYLDTLDWVERYCWFGPFRKMGTVGVNARMYDDEGKLTSLGKGYRDV